MSKPPGQPETKSSDSSLRQLPIAARMVVRLLQPWVRRTTRLEGADNLSRLEGPAILALNHNNTIECCAVPIALLAARDGRPIHFLIDWMYLEIPLLGWLLSQVGPIPVYTKRARFGFKESYRKSRQRSSAFEHALSRLATGGTVGLFPEGVRNRASELAPARRGLGCLALAAAVPVVPIGIELESTSLWGPRFLRERLVVRVGLPKRYSSTPRLLAEVDRQEAALVSAEVMSTIAELSSKTVPRGRRPLRRAGWAGQLAGASAWNHHSNLHGESP